MNSQLIFFVFIIQILGLNSINPEEIVNKTKDYINQGKKIVNTNNSLTSDEIWSKTKKYIKQGKMILNRNKTHFIFDESNYTKVDIYSNKMKSLYKKQEEFFKKFNLSTYIFIIDDLDKTELILDKAVKNLKNHLEKEYKINNKDSIIILISVKSKIVIVSDFPRLIQSLYGRGFFQVYLQIFLVQKKYYDALDSLLEKLYLSYSLYFIAIKICIIVLIILILLIIAIYLIIKIKNCYKKNTLNKNNDGEIINEGASNELCSICSVKFSDINDKEKEEKNIEDLDSVTSRLLNKTEKEKIEIFKCGHKFHSKCISNLKKSNNNLNNDCPLCIKKKIRIENK